MSRPRNSSASCNTNQYAVRELAITSVTREVVIPRTFLVLKLLPQGQGFFYTEAKFGLDLKYTETLKRLS